MRVFISTTSFSEYSRKPLDLLRENNLGFEINPYKRKLSEQEIKEILSGKSYLGLIAGTEPITREVLSKARSLKVISRVGVGLDNIDLEAARDYGIDFVGIVNKNSRELKAFSNILKIRHFNLIK